MVVERLLIYVVELPREQCAEEAFDIIVKLNSNRILGRLASSHFQRSPHEGSTPRRPLTVRLKEYIASRMPAQQSSQTSAEFETLSAQIDTFHASFLQLESSTPGDIVSITKSVVKDALPITVDGFSLPT